MNKTENAGLFGNVRKEIQDVIRSEQYLQNTEKIDKNIQLLMNRYYHEQERN